MVNLRPLVLGYDYAMRGANSPVLINRLSISLRWVTLLGLSVTIAAQERFSIYLTITFLAVGIWNLGLMAMNALTQRLAPNRYLIVALDLLAANLMFYFSGHLLISLGWIGILPLIPSALYFERDYVFIVALVSAFSLGIQAILSTTPLSALIFISAASVFYIAFGLLLFYMRGGFISLLGRIRRERMAVQPESDRADHERQPAIYNLISGLNATLNFQNVLETTLDLSIKALETSEDLTKGLVCSVLLYPENNSNGAHLQIRSARRFTHADMRASISLTRGLIGRAIDGGKPLLSKKIHDDDELKKFVALRACQSAYCVPLCNGLDTYGALFFAHPDGNYFTPERREILKMVADQARIAIQNAKLYHDLELEKESIIKTREESRKKLARTLHDGLTQSVAALAMRVNFARRLLERDDKSVAEELLKVEDLARRTTKEIRHILFTLKPPILESEGLIAALQSLADKMLEIFGQNVIIEVDPEVLSHLEMNKQNALLSMAEEAVNSARKHAKAEDIWVRLKSIEPDSILLEIEDNGIRFDANDVAPSDLRHNPLSMTNIREQAELVNGAVSIQSAKENGTLLQVVINLSE